MVHLGIAAEHLHWSPTAVFTISFFAIIPPAAILSFATERISIIITLKEGQIEVVQLSMLGPFLSQGMAQSLASATAQTTCSLMTLSS
ncbi:hypothetical protein LZ30DRAFT_827811 [Colletotrichum cereale]|nr:hypothetical protein LZ30DRAFT_827811 [Colletotrichum cereale]